MINILFVCTGNICRSPTAEGVFRHLVDREGLSDRLSVDSAGTHAYHVGESPDHRSIAAAARRGYDLSDLRARVLVPADYDRFDLLLAMDRGHLEIMRRKQPPGSRARLALFMAEAPAPLTNRDVPDPYYGEGRHFGEVLDLVEAGSRAWIKVLTSQA
ncbi:low molecular weight protein-tyrosine-phosphatase [Niveispirillum sp. BGYR6]|uniref:low molecular weight protein-tyrosine-phosphatase n=1 Tax=Niveispirillum sp. BGYR6 TaxID=2971249 RepID=UPI0022B9D3B6|nr:low molecular weight protein-tyrosine-phosphatase [Niveispirillum sp. BGYR6]MDG5497638.1 low molecular weight phosphotyrosine protein phosphatase [Niveispirillum sp. BGYR6]